MTLAQVQATVWFVLALIGTWAGLMISVALLLPHQSRKAVTALENTTWLCFLIGIGMLVVFGIGSALASIPVPLIKLMGVVILLSLGGIVALGAAGLAQLMARRIGDMTGTESSFKSLVQGSVVFSLALGFPFIGWLLFTPLAVLCALGAGVCALLPARQQAYAPITPPVTPNAPDFDVFNNTKVG